MVIVYVNYYDYRYYASPKSIYVVNKVGARVTGGLKKIINGHCLSGVGLVSMY